MTVSNAPKCGSPIPGCIFGTARISDPSIVLQALRCGYRAFDTAGQPQFYDEAILGRALETACTLSSKGGLGLNRENLYIQTKFTTPAGQKFPNAPYSIEDELPVMVEKSIRRSLESMNLSYIDTYLMHGPMPTIQETIEVWRVMESFVPYLARSIGLSNVTLEQIQSVVSISRVLPTAVQNRFQMQTCYDIDIRKFCTANDIVYQAFSVVRSNAPLMRSQLVGWLAERAEISEVAALYCLILSLGGQMCVLNGSMDEGRFTADLRAIEAMGTLPEFLVDGFKAQLDLMKSDNGA